MARQRLADSDCEDSVISALAGSLMKLHARHAAATLPVMESSPEPIDWQDRWSNNKTQISRRLELIRCELNRLELPESD